MEVSDLLYLQKTNYSALRFVLCLCNCSLSGNYAFMRVVLPINFVISVNYKFTTMLYGQVSIDPEIMSGTAVFAGTRVPVKNLFNYIEGAKT